ncbi:SpoIIE family protein phosphatase [Thermophilibacter sp.]
MSGPVGAHELSRRPVGGIGEGSVAGTLSLLLQLTGEAVLVFDGAGRVLLANDEACELMAGGGVLVGTDVRLLFPPAGPDAGEGPFDPASLPFSLDGTVAMVTCAVADGRALTLRVRCEAVRAPGETFLLVALPTDGDARRAREEGRALEDLVRANHRLSGTLRIVLDTLDADDLPALLDRLLEEITETMEADGTIVYLAESDGFHLRGLSSGLADEKVARFMPFGRSIERVAVRGGSAVRLRVSAPGTDALRQGRLAERDVVCEETGETVKVRSSLVPPFTSFMAVPVWFGGRVISIIEVGWRARRPMPKDDAQLLDAVAHYLSVQLEGTFTALRSRRAEHLADVGTRLREELLDAATADATPGVLGCLERVLEVASEELEADLALVRDNEHQALVVADLPLGGPHELACDLEALAAPCARDGVAVAPVLPDSALAAELRGLGEPCVGALVDLGEMGGARWRALMLRPDGAEPLGDIELEFLEELAADARDIARGEEEREQDKRIAQALQTGMRNELQDVPGITAEAVYSSATASASVGGDFYDLIRLPGRRACVIMGDVSGKGVEAASVSAAVKTALGAYAWEGLAPARMVRSLNEFLLGFSRLETFATLFVGIVDLAAGTIRYCSAGHPPAILVRAGADELSILDVQSGVVGAFHDIAYVDGEAALAPGDVLLLYTDGTTEARDPSGAFFGEQGLRDAVMRESAGEKRFEGFVGRLLGALDDFTGARLEDDVAMVALRFDELGPADETGPDGEKGGVSG